MTCHYAKFGATLYVERYGRTPNYLAQQDAVLRYATPGVGRLPTWTIANLSANYAVLPGLTLSVNANNLFGRLPRIDYSTPGIATAPINVENYNSYGRSYFVEANYKCRKNCVPAIRIRSSALKATCLHNATVDSVVRLFTIWAS